MIIIILQNDQQQLKNIVSDSKTQAQIQRWREEIEKCMYFITLC